MEVMLRRSKYRDYYDIYCLIESGENLNEMISLALKYSGHRLKSKNLLAMLTRSDRFIQDDNFAALNPIYEITPMEIERRIIAELSKQKWVTVKTTGERQSRESENFLVC